MTMSPATQALLMALTIGAVMIPPGPTNTLLFLAGARQGVRHSLALVGVQVLGYYVGIGNWCAFLALAATFAPGAPTVARVFAAVYMGYLAIKTWRQADTQRQDNNAKPVRWHAVFIATLLNPKAYFLAVVVFPPIGADGTAFFFAYTLLTGLAIPIGIGWICIGASVAARVASPSRQVMIHRSAALVLSAFSAGIWVTLLG